MKIVMDTGPWVALIDRSESRHKECVRWLERFDGSILTTEPVLTEVLYLLDFSATSQSAALDFVLTGALTLVPADIESLTTVQRLMMKYSDLPMDFADATLVALAQDLDVEDILTFDSHFNIYRLKGKRRFNVVP
jgi:predicted nucleic acid-binding protein